MLLHAELLLFYWLITLKVFQKMAAFELILYGVL